jgi:hypothetical protein
LAKEKAKKLHSVSFSPVCCYFLPPWSKYSVQQKRWRHKKSAKAFNVNVLTGCCENGDEHSGSEDGDEFID